MGSDVKIPKGCTAGLDTMVFIYSLDSHPEFGEVADAILARIERGELKAVASSLLFAELLPHKFARNDAVRARAIARELENMPNLAIMPLTNEVSVEAARLRATYGLRTPDAVHAATAMGAGAQGIVTNDGTLKRLTSEGLDVWMLDELTC